MKTRKSGVFMLEIVNLSFKYDDTGWLFKDVNFSIQPGEIVGMYGKSGSGKTTLLKVIAGYLSPVEGNIFIDGRKSIEYDVQPVQLIWQHPEKAINPKWKLINVVREVEGLDERILDLVGIQHDWFERRPYELSGGEMQRFCIARALGPNTRYILADEITSMFDAITQAQIWHAMMELVKELNIGLLAISHHIHLLKKISDRIINFHDISNIHISSQNTF